MRNHFLRASGIPSSGGGDSGGGGSSIVDTDLYIHYDFSDTDCWNRQNGTNTDDYTVHNLANDYNDALFRSRTGGSNTWQQDSSSPVIGFNSSDGGGCLEMDPGNNDGDEDDCCLTIPGSFSHSTNTGYFLYNIPTVSSTDSNNLWNGVGTGAFTIEFWERYHCKNNNDSFYSKANIAPYAVVTETTAWRFPLRWNVFGDAPSEYASDYKHKMWNSNPSASGWEKEALDIPGAPSSGSGWSDWCHVVFSRASNATDDSKLYLNNSLVETDTYPQTLEYSVYTSIVDPIFTNVGMRFRMGVFRIYRGKALTSSEVTTNWNAQKSRFGH